MKLEIALLVLLLIPSANAVNGNKKFKTYHKDRYIDVEVVEKNNLRVNSFCIKNPSCEALNIAKSKPFKIQTTQAPFVGNPGANYCWDVGAKNRILVDEKNNQYDFCVFDDGSMIDAWNLYAKHYPPKRIK